MTAEEADAIREKAWAEIDAGNFPAAEAGFQRILDALPDHTLALFGRGYARLRLRRWQESGADFSAVLQRDANNVDGHVNRAICHINLGDGPAAFADADRAAALNPTYDLAPFQRARAHLMLNRPAEAAADLEQARALGCKIADLDYYLSLALGRQQKFSEALAAVEKYAAFDPGAEGAHLQKGWVLRNLGRHDEAIAALTQAIGIAPTLASAWSNRGYAKKAKGLKAEAAADFRKAMELEPAWTNEMREEIGEIAPAPPVAVAHVDSGDTFAHRALVVGGCLLGAAIYIGLALLNIPVASSLPQRSIDIPYKAWFIANNWPNNDVCMHPFCLQTDTQKEHAWGRPGYTSETKLSYCAAHDPSFMDNNSKIDGCFSFWYFIFCFIAMGTIMAAAGTLVFRLAMWPALVPMTLAKKIPASFLLPGDIEAPVKLDRNLTVTGGVLGIIAGFAALLLYIWW